MATVDKDFRVKHGLVVEGTTATVNGEDVITTGNTTDDITEGSTNLYFTAQRAADAVADEINTAVSTAINALDTDDIEEGTTNQYYTTARAKGDAADLLTNATLTNITITGNEDGLTITAENGVADSDTDDLTEGATNLYFTNQRALDATASAYDATGTAQGIVDALDTDDISEGMFNQYFTNQRALDATASAYDATGTAQGIVDALDTDDIEEGTTNKYYSDTLVDNHLTGGDGITYSSGDISVDVSPTGGLQINILSNDLGIKRSEVDTWYDANGAAATAETNANTYTDTQLTNYTPTANLDTTIDGYGYLKSADLTGYATETYVDTAVANLVDGAPALLDTLNELAAALEDNPDVIADLRDIADGKQNTLTAGSNINITGDTISVTGLDTDDVSEGTNLYFTNQRALDATSAAYDAAGAAATAEQNAKDYADANFVNVDDLPGQLDDYVPLTQKGANDGVATLDSTGQVPLSQLGNVPADFITSIKSGETNLSVTSGELSLTATPSLTSVSVSQKIFYTGEAVTEANKVPSVSATTSVHQFPENTYDAVKYTVRTSNASGDKEISEVLVAVDGSGNISITEYGNVATNVSLSSISAGRYSDGKGGYYIALDVTPVSGTITVSVFATMLVI